jgi:transaldolase
VLAEMQLLKQNYEFRGKIMGAGIRDVNMIQQCMKLGISAVTLPDTVFDQFIKNHPQTLQALDKFAEDWDNLHSFK